MITLETFGRSTSFSIGLSEQERERESRVSELRSVGDDVIRLQTLMVSDGFLIVSVNGFSICQRMLTNGK